ncbi:hypothetical protein [Luteibacter sp. ME-Dv--P-043b]|jgi:hypothetical protein|uniref:hypothetical protein n=1 Tax=unclassified Luteibacter TaxID=2620188 RepID=UPI00255341FE|nr:hypothetical protein [Luteibacter sp. ME-Dv--P-043b]
MCAIHAATRPNPAHRLTGSASKHVAHIVRSYTPGRFAHIVRSYAPDRFAQSVRSYKYIGDFNHA